MTTIMAVQRHDGCTIAADSRTITSDGRRAEHQWMQKIRNRAEYIVGAAGPGGICEAVLWDWAVPFPGTGSAYEVMQRQVVPSLRSFLGGLGHQWGSAEESLQIIIALQGQAFILDVDGTVIVVTDHFGIGSGSPYAMGALAGGLSLTQAMDIAARYDINTGGRQYFLTQNRVYP